jgi:hypothetical protein
MAKAAGKAVPTVRTRMAEAAITNRFSYTHASVAKHPQLKSKGRRGRLAYVLNIMYCVTAQSF